MSSSASATEPDPLLSVDQVARWLGKPKATLYAWRSRGLGPRAIRVGNVLRYRRSEVEGWLDANTDDRR
ncbi:helix-turn-helix transcriptional regulator [Virgisporangium ochraceum]|uniref:helix-turn-helix transcriptional regulator n=1 Tax=Virgisporangium ochraceum TaxID=65505 RepID=UPI001EF1E555|nr:helix-turn-helix domain-containing protein [Virgisporangium ochraceum]